MSDVAFGERLQLEFESGRRLCAGIDPHPHLLAEWNLEKSAQGIERFGLAVVEAAQNLVAAVKPQVAFFERYGSAGFQALERVIAAARQAGLLVIADAKRGDVGSSFDAYADAWLQPGSPLEADALTASAFQGFGVLNQALQHVREHGKGLFVLAATSNPEARTVQTAVCADTHRTVSAQLVDEINNFNHAAGPPGTLGSVGAVFGATISLDEYGIATDRSAEITPRMPVLAPGFGHQGGTVQEVRRSFGAYFDSVLVSESRSILAGERESLRRRIADRAEQLHNDFLGAR